MAGDSPTMPSWCFSPFAFPFSAREAEKASISEAEELFSQSDLKDDIILFTRFTQLELLQGAKDEAEWKKLDEYLESQIYLEATKNTWKAAARIYFDLRRIGKTINSPIDCCISQIKIVLRITTIDGVQSDDR